MSSDAGKYLAKNNVKLRYRFYDVRLIITLAFLLLCVTGTLEYRLWNQVVYIWEANWEITELVGHPHFFRYLLVLPIFLLADTFAISYDWMFSMIFPLLVVMASVFLVGALEHTRNGLTKNAAVFSYGFVFSFLFMLSMFMNGRIMFAICASSVLLYLFLHWEYSGSMERFLLSLAGCFLASVSSGTFSIALLATLFFLLSRLKVKRRLAVYVFFLPILSLVAFILTYIFIGLVEKNYTHFGSGLEALSGMLNHGLGRLLFLFEAEMIVFSGCVFLLLLATLLLLAEIVEKLRTAILMIVLSLGGGLFGLSTVMMMIPPGLFIIGSLLLDDELNRKLCAVLRSQKYRDERPGAAISDEA